MRLLEEHARSFARGMNDIASPVEYRPDEVALIHNGRVSFDGRAIKRRNGSKRSHASALNSGTQCYGAIEFTTAAGAQQLVVFMGDTAYYSTDEGVTWTQIATSLRTDYWSLVIAREGSSNKLFAANGSTNYYSWDGTTWTSISTGPAAGVKFLAVFNDRLYAAGHSGVTVAASAVGDFDDFTAASGAFTVKIQTHDGDTAITGLYQVGSALLVFKRQSTSYISGFGFNTITVESGARGVSRSIGCLAHRSIRAVSDTAIMWLSERGFEYFQLGGAITLVSRPIQNFMDTLAWSNIIDDGGIPTALHWPSASEYWCAVPVGGTQNNWIFAFRPPTEESPPAVWLFTWPGAAGDTLTVDSTTGYLDVMDDQTASLALIVSGYLELDTALGLYVEVDASTGYLELVTVDYAPAALFVADRDTDVAIPFGAGYDGFLREMEKGDTDNQSATDEAGEAVPMRVDGRPLYFERPFRKKRGRILRVLAQNNGATEATVTVRLVADGVAGTARNLTYSVLGGQQPETKRARMNAKGFAITPDIRTTDAVLLAGLALAAEPLREPA